MSTYEKRLTACVGEKGKNGKTYWNNIGAGFLRVKDGRTMISVELRANPTDGKFVLFEATQREERKPESKPHNEPPHDDGDKAAKYSKGGRR